MGRVKLARPVLFVVLTALLSTAAAASVPSTNSPLRLESAHSLSVTTLRSALNVGVAEAPPDQTHRFELGEASLLDEPRRADFHLEGAALLDEASPRAPPQSYPETRVWAIDFLGSTLISRSTELRLESHWACGDLSCGIASDGREDPLGLMDPVTREKLIQQRAEYAESCAQGCIGAPATDREQRQADLQTEAIEENNRIAFRYLTPKVAGDYVALWGTGFQRPGPIETAYVPRLSDARPSLIPPSKPVVVPAAPPVEVPIPFVPNYSDAGPPQVLSSGPQMAPSHGPAVIQGSGGPGKVYEIPAAELKAEKPYIGKTRRTLPQRMGDKDHRAKTPTGKAPTAVLLAENLTSDEAAGLETVLAHQRGLENLSNVIPPLNPNLPKNKPKIDAATRLLQKSHD